MIFNLYVDEFEVLPPGDHPESRITTGVIRRIIKKSTLEKAIQAEPGGFPEGFKETEIDKYTKPFDGKEMPSYSF